ncbi:MAG: PepSY-associated TM helix domain-containing protein [Bryobacteraceae bacterium]
MTAWQQWLQHPERFWVRKALFQIHLWLGAGVGLYVVMMSVTGSIIVFRDELSKWFSVEWLVKLHENLLLGENGRRVNGIGAICVTTVCLTGAWAAHSTRHDYVDGDRRPGFQATLPCSF